MFTGNIITESNHTAANDLMIFELEHNIHSTKFSNNTFDKNSTRSVDIFRKDGNATVILSSFYNNILNEIDDMATSGVVGWGTMSNGRDCIPIHNCISSSLDTVLDGYTSLPDYDTDDYKNLIQSPYYVTGSYALDWTTEGPELIGAGYDPDMDNTSQNDINQALRDQFDETADIGAVAYDDDRFVTYSFAAVPTINWKSFPILDKTTEMAINGTDYAMNVPGAFFDEFTGLNSDMVWAEFQDEGTSGYTSVFHYPNTPLLTYHIDNEYGSKLKFDNVASMDAHGITIEEDHVIDVPFGDEATWVGYFLEDDQLPTDAFGEYMDEVYYIQAHNWTMARQFPVRGSAWSNGRVSEIKYGDMVIIKRFDDVQAIDSYAWDPATSKSNTPDTEIPEPVHFQFVEEANYYPIFVETGVDTELQEIAVYVNGECRGAGVVYSEGSTMVPLYYDNSESIDENTQFNLIGWAGDAKSNVEIEQMFGEQHGYSFYSMVEEADSPEVSGRYTISNYPNPFNPTTIISFSIPKDENVEISVFNIKGQKVKTVVNDNYTTGSHKVVWDGTDENNKSVTSGIYFYKLKTSSKTLTNKMILMK